MPPSTRRPGPKQPLSPERIIDTAAAIIDHEGIDALTMRRVARELGVASTAIYWHVRTRDDLLKGVLERAISEVAIPEVDEVEWEEGLRILCRSLATVLQHPHIVALAQQVPSDAAYLVLHRKIAILLSAGFSAEDAVDSAVLLQSYVYGFTAANARSSSLHPRQNNMAPESLAAWFKVAGDDGATLLHYYLNIDHVRLFERGLDDHLAGLRRALTISAAGTVPRRNSRVGRKARP
jgi:AcrR family transcriptional regulator